MNNVHLPVFDREHSQHI